MEIGGDRRGPNPAPAAGEDAGTVDLLVGARHCPSCSALVQETLLAEPGVRQAAVDLVTGRASVTFDGRPVAVEDQCGTVAGLGYSATASAAGDPAPTC